MNFALYLSTSTLKKTLSSAISYDPFTHVLHSPTSPSWASNPEYDQSQNLGSNLRLILLRIIPRARGKKVSSPCQCHGQTKDVYVRVRRNNKNHHHNNNNKKQQHATRVSNRGCAAVNSSWAVECLYLNSTCEWHTHTYIYIYIYT